MYSSMSHYWTSVDLDAGRCTLDQLGLSRPQQEVLDAAPMDNSPESMKRVALNTLFRLAQGNEPHVALKAALALLDRAPLLQAPALLASPDWAAPDRLAYRQSPSLEPPEPPAEATRIAATALKPPASYPTTTPPGETLLGPPISVTRTFNQDNPLFHDGPNQPWDGQSPFRRPNGCSTD
jgi:hypothetical protein